MAVTTMIGAKIHRREDPRLVSGHGRYTDDFVRPDTAYLAVIRSPYAHARILSIDVSGDAAAVKLAESRFWDQDFIDFFLLSRIDGEWQIVAKSFDHIGPTA